MLTAQPVAATGYRKILELTYVAGTGSLAADEDITLSLNIAGESIRIDKAGPYSGRTTYDDEASGFTYASTDGADGGGLPTVIYTKNSATCGDWSAAVPFQGPTAATPNLVEGVILTGEPGSAVAASITGTNPDYELNLSIPKGDQGINWRPAYDALTQYAENDGVEDNGSSWRALQPTIGNTPPILPVTSNAHWTLVSRRGVDGAGTVAGVAAGTGIAVNSADPTNPVVSAPAMTGDAGAGGDAGIVPAPGAGDAAAKKFLKADGSWAIPAPAVLDEDDFATNSPTQPPSQQSAGAFVLSNRAPDVILEETQAAGTNGGDFIAGGWRDRLNLETHDPRALCTFTGPSFVLEAGSYYVEWDAVAYFVERNQTRLLNLTDGVVVRSGSPAFAAGGGSVTTFSKGTGVFSVGPQKQ